MASRLIIVTDIRHPQGCSKYALIYLNTPELLARITPRHFRCSSNLPLFAN